MWPVGLSSGLPLWIGIENMTFFVRKAEFSGESNREISTNAVGVAIYLLLKLY